MRAILILRRGAIAAALALLLTGCAQVRSDSSATGAAVLINPLCLLICVGRPDTSTQPR